MQIIINIDKDIYNHIVVDSEYFTSSLVNVFKNGTPIPDNATNGDVIKAMFPNAKVDDYDYGKDPVIDVYGIDDTEYITLRKEWWNEPYQKGGK